MLGVAAASFLYLAFSLLTWNQIEEDTFIYLRNAANLAQGNGYLFNLGLPAIETSSSFLWLILLTALHWLPIPIIPAVKVLCIGFGLMSLVLTGALGAKNFDRSWVASIAPLLLAVSVPFVMWGQRGLETPFYTFLLLWTALWVCSDRHHRHAWIPAAALLFGRPEAPVFAFGLLLFVGIFHGRSSGIAKQFGLLLAIATVAELARFVYFHDLVSHAFYLKAQRNTGSARILWGFVLNSNLLWLAVPIAAVGWRRSFWTRERTLAAILTGLLTAWAARTGDPMAYNRQFVPALPFFYLLVVSAIDTLCLPLGRRSRFAAAAALAALWGLIALNPSVPYLPHNTAPNPIHAAVAHTARDPVEYASAVSQEIRDANTRTILDDDTLMPIEHNWQALIGKYIAANYPPDVVVVYDQMGQTPYYAGLETTFIDSFGLTYRPTGLYQFGRRAGKDPILRTYDSLANSLISWVFPLEGRQYSRSQSLDSIFDQRPDVVLVNRFAAAAGRMSVTATIRDDRRLRKNFAPRYLLAGWTELYERRGFPNVDPIVPDGLDIEPLGADSSQMSRRARGVQN